MAIYISKNAIKKIPEELNSVYLPNFLKSGQLLSNIFKREAFFQSLAQGLQGADHLKKGDQINHLIIRRLQIAINAVSQKFSINERGILIDGDFGPITEEALKNIQQQLGLSPTGILDAQTLIGIDRELNNTLYNTTNGEYHSDAGDFSFLINETENRLPFKTKPKNNAPQQTGVGLENGKFVKAIKVDVSQAQNFGYVDTDNFNADISKNSGGFLQLNTLDGIVQLEPNKDITEQPEPGARLVKVGPNDTLVSLLFDAYYRDEYPILRNPEPGDPNAPQNDLSNPNNIIHTFPRRELKKDTRLKFITNMVFYMNHDPEVNNGVRFRGGIQTYTDEDLDRFSIYDNDHYDLNYKVFVDKLDAEKAAYQWEFTDNASSPAGVDAPIELPEGTYIWLPSRSYVEGMYYSLNYQPANGKMYTQKKRTLVTGEEEAYNDWTSVEQHKSFTEKAEEYLIRTLGYTIEVTDSIVETYNEAKEYFEKMYDWVQEVANIGWPRGFGITGDAGLSAAAPIFGLPLQGRVQGDTQILRKVTNNENFVIGYREKFSTGIGFGVGFSQGTFSTKRKKKGAAKNLGAGKAGKKDKNYGIGVSAGVEVTLNLEKTSFYEFDVSKSNMPLIAMAIAMFDTTLNQAATKASGVGLALSPLKDRLFDFTEYVFSANLDPEDYLIQDEVGLYLEGRIYADAYIGEIPDPDKWAVDNVKKVDQLKSGGLASLITKLTGGVSVSSDNFVRYGGKYTYKAEYGDAPEVYTGNFRMPSEASIEGEIYAEAQLQFSYRFDSFLARFVTAVISRFIPLWIPSFNLHGGMAVTYELSYNRKGTPEDHEFFAAIEQPLSLFGVEDPNNNIAKKIGFKIFSGDLDTPLQAGSEMQFVLEFAKIKEFVSQAANEGGEILDYVTNIDTLVQLFNKFSIRKRVALLDGVTNRASRSAKKTVESPRARSKKFYKDAFGENKIVQEILKDSSGSFETAVEAEATLETVEVVNTFKFIYEYLRFVLSEAQYTGTDLAKYKEVEQQMRQLICKAKDTVAVASTESFFDASVLTTIFDDAYAQLQSLYTEEGFNANLLKPYTSVIGNFIATIDAEGVINTVQQLPERITKTASPYLTEIAELLKQVIKFMLTKSQLNVLVENKLEFGFEQSFEISKGYKWALGFYASAGIYSKIEVLEKGNLTAIFKSDDPYFEILRFMIKALGAVSPTALSLSTNISNLLIENTLHKTQAPN